MKIETVGITYSELRTFGNYENKRYGITLEASLEAGETASCVKAKLTEIAKTQVKEEEIIRSKQNETNISGSF